MTRSTAPLGVVGSLQLGVAVVLVSAAFALEQRALWNWLAGVRTLDGSAS